MPTNDFEIKTIERIPVHLPFHPRCADVMEVRVLFWSVIDLYKVVTVSGVVGYGELLTRDTWFRPEDPVIARVIGRTLFDVLWDDTLGSGVQMALFDAAGKALGVPCHRLFGIQHRETCPVSWWTQEASPELWAAEVKAAEENGYTSMKAKARPWFDVHEQLAAMEEVASRHFKVDLDFNQLLLGVDEAARIISDLENQHPMLAIVESPIPQGDVPGNVLLRHKINTPIAMHYGNPPIMTAIKEGVCDGFVIGGGASRVMRNASVSAQANMPFWLQIVGTGLTTTFSVHLGAVLSHARWPAIPCVNIYEHPLITGFTVESGHVKVPENPGLGVELDWDVIENHRVDLDFKAERRRQIHTIHWPDNRQAHYPDAFYRQEFLSGKHVGFLPGISLDHRLDDGSEEFDQEYRELFGEHYP
ncbi:MAG: mandelate racemase/muconate lactonizing enzyme family protein [Gemmatimonadota bacterium]|nr:mandelate racemase/muconate lactonizing enzyme family protein [Gemmatimonadota bacterium]